jgi:hypothetical protein
MSIQTPSSLHRPLGITLKLIKLHFLIHPTQTTGSAMKDKLLAWFLLALLVKGKHALYSDFLFEHLKGFYFILPSSKLL